MRKAKMTFGDLYNYYDDIIEKIDNKSKFDEKTIQRIIDDYTIDNRLIEDDDVTFLYRHLIQIENGLFVIDYGKTKSKFWDKKSNKYFYHQPVEVVDTEDQSKNLITKRKFGDCFGNILWK